MSLGRDRRCHAWLVAALVCSWLPLVSSQQLLDRVLATGDGFAIALTDVNAAVALGVILVPDQPDRESAAVQRLIERQLMLAEVARFAPREPDAAAVADEAAAMKARVGSHLADMMASTGLDDA